MSRVFSGFCLFLQSRKKSTFSRPLSLFGLFGNIGRNPNLRSSRLTAGKNGGKFWAIVALIYMCLYVVAQPLCSGNVSRRRTFTSRLRWTRNKKGVKLKPSTLVNKGNLAMIFRLDLNQGIYIHFLRRKWDNSILRYWLSARRGLWEDVHEDGDKNKSQPSAWEESAGRTKTTNLHHHQGGFRGVEEIAWSGGHVTVWRNQRKVPGEHVADRRNLVGPWSTEATKNNIQLYFEVILLDANTSSTDEVSSVSDTVHLELFSDFARRRHVHHTSDFFHTARPFLVMVRVGRFSWDLFVLPSFGKKRCTPSAVDCTAGTTELTEFAVIRSPLTKYVFSKSSTC